jgi:hypothetical protein
MHSGNGGAMQGACFRKYIRGCCARAVEASSEGLWFAALLMLSEARCWVLQGNAGTKMQTRDRERWKRLDAFPGQCIAATTECPAVTSG